MGATTASTDLRANAARVESRLADAADHGGPDPEDVPAGAKLALAIAEPARNRDAPAGPTRTKTIQRDYAAEMYKRFRRVKGLVRQTVERNDAFGLRGDDAGAGDGGPTAFARLDSTPTSDYTFPTTGEKVDAFLDDLARWEDDEILEVRRRVGGRVAEREAWQDIYVRRSYAKGAEWADARMREQGIAVPQGATPETLFNAPVHADALGVLRTRNFRELEGITDAVDQEVSRVLSRGFAEGWNPRKMASAINDRVEKVGLTRARTLARTEVINAHSTATLNRYEEVLGPDAEVTGQAEFSTAGDNDVCTICLGLEGETFTLDEARGIIPVHPNCRCAWLPVVDSSSANAAAIAGAPARRVA